MPLILDFESRSRVDLTEVGGRVYWDHPSSEALCCAWLDTDSGQVGVWLPGGEQPPADAGRAWVAHNANGFDRFATRRLNWTQPATWIDSSELARCAGQRGSLAAILGDGDDKDSEGSAVTKSLSRGQIAGHRTNPNTGVYTPGVPEELRPFFKPYHKAFKADPDHWPPVPPEIYERVVDYNVSDVSGLAGAWAELSEWNAVEPDVREVSFAVNDRGVMFDGDLACALLLADERLTERILAESARVVGMTTAEVRAIVGSPEQLCEATGLDNAQKETIAKVLDQADTPAWVRALCIARQSLASIARGKLIAGILRQSPDGALRDMFYYFAAHTGRYGGRAIQLHNMPRPEKRFEKISDDELCRLADEVMSGARLDVDPGEMDLLLRASCMARPGCTLVVDDFSGVEARGNAWCADDIDAIRAFIEGQPIYEMMAAEIFGVPVASIGKDEKRQVGKVAELACGYGMGGPKFEWTANRALAAEGKGTLESMGIFGADVVAAWRRKHKQIVRFWYALNDAFIEAIRGETASVNWRFGRFDFVPSSDGQSVAVFLPSGRPVVYNGTRLSTDERGRPRIRYQSEKGTADLYGGKICENLIQALCRDLMVDAMVRAERAGLRPVMHVHDEIVCEVPHNAGAEGLAELQRIMTTLPEWARGFPMAAAGHHGRRYRK